VVCDLCGRVAKESGARASDARVVTRVENGFHRVMRNDVRTDMCARCRADWHHARERHRWNMKAGHRDLAQSRQECAS
jgi:Zn-finger nucleic acid-binding protein